MSCDADEERARTRTTFAPKNFRISASLSRCAKETASSAFCLSEKERAAAEALFVERVTCCRSGYLDRAQRMEVQEYVRWLTLQTAPPTPCLNRHHCP